MLPPFDLVGPAVVGPEYPSASTARPYYEHHPAMLMPSDGQPRSIYLQYLPVAACSANSAVEIEPVAAVPELLAVGPAVAGIAAPFADSGYSLPVHQQSRAS